MATEDDYEDDLELLEQYDLEASDSDASSAYSYDSSGNAHRSSGSRRAHGQDDDADDGHDADNDDMDDSHRIEQLKIPILSICSALGGYEEEADQNGRIRSVYKLGDDCLACLRDLRRLWRQDDTDPSRAIARVFAQVNVLHNDLIPILLQTAGKGGKNDKVALACTDLLTAMTWPIDAMAEIHDAVTKDDDAEHVISLPELEKAQVQYKSSILRIRTADGGQQRDVLSVVLRHILLPAVSKPRIDRTERDVGVIGMSLHLFRNLLTIRDPIATTLSSTDVLANATLQSSLIIAMEKAHILDTLLMLASSSDTREFNQWNAVTSECIYQIFVGTSAKALADVTAGKATEEEPTSSSVARAASSALSSVLAAEAKEKRASILSTGATRHSRFGTTINFVGPDGHRRVARSQAALKKSVAQLTDENLAKAKRKAQRRKKAREVGAPKLKASWTAQAAVLLQSWADRFLETGFETLTRTVLQDIRSEREKMGDLDLARIRVMQLGAFFLEYFFVRKTAAEAQQQSTQARSTAKGKQRAVDADSQDQAAAVAAADAQAVEGAPDPWPFSYIAGWLEPWAFKMVLVRSVDAQESRSWLEFVSAVQLWTVLLRLVDKMSRSKKDEEREVAEGLQAQLYYLGETLDACHTIVRAYSRQSFACLDAILTFAHILPKMLERYSSNKEHMYVRARKQVRKSRQEGELDAAEDEAAQIREQAKETQTEREFRFIDFQKKLCTRQLAGACIMYLLRWKEFTEPEEQVGKVVAIMHRIAIKAGDYRQFFVGDCRAVFRTLLTGPALTTLEPKAPGPVKDLRKFMDYILRKFSKLDIEEQTKFETGKRIPKPVKEPKVPAEIRVRDGHSYAEQIGIAVGLLLQKEKMEATLWVKSGLEMASIQRAEILLSEERADADTEGGVGGHEMAADKIKDYELLYGGKEEVRLDASILPELKLLCRLVGLESNEDDKLHWRWTVPARLLPATLDERSSLIEESIRDPYRPPSGIELPKLVQRKMKPRAGVVRPSTFSSSDNDDDDDSSSASVDEEGNPRPRQRLVGGKKKKWASKPAGPKMARKPRSQKKWTEENFIEDSDEELAFAMALGGVEAADSDQEEDAASGAARGDTPPTSLGMEDDEEEEGGHNGFTADKGDKMQSLQALRDRRRALFLGGAEGGDAASDDEASAASSASPHSTPEHDEDDDDENMPPAPLSRSPSRERTAASKRSLFFDPESDEEDNDEGEVRRQALQPSLRINIAAGDDDDDEAVGNISTQSATKRRRIVVDSDEDE